jgi:2'-5' RNA ligase
VRLFVAVDLPAEVVGHLSGLARPELASLRWTTPEQWHVTVRFLGEVPASDLEGAAGLVAALDTVPDALAAAGVGRVEASLGPASAWFPGRQVLQVPVAGLDELAGAVALVTGAWGDEERGFRGHLTLARARARLRGPASLAGVAVAASWVVAELVLYSSSLGPGGPRYTVLHRVALPGADGPKGHDRKENQGP